jgi:hypothetical protein
LTATPNGLETRTLSAKSGRGFGVWSGKSATSSTVRRSPAPFESVSRSPPLSAAWSAAVSVKPAVNSSTLAGTRTARSELSSGDEGFGLAFSVPGAGPGCTASPAPMTT